MSTLEIKDLHKHVPLGWFNALHRCNFWMTGFRILTTKDRQVERGKFYDLDADTRVLLWFGAVQHLVADGGLSAAFQHPDGRAQITWNPSKVGPTHNVNWLVILQKCQLDDTSAATRCADRSSMLGGLVAATIGDNWVYERCFDHGVRLPQLETSMLPWPFTITPNYLALIDTSYNRLEVVKAAFDTLGKLADRDRRRLELALHWYELGRRAFGIDAFLQLWIALEAVAANDQRWGEVAIKLALRDIYKIKPEEKAELDRFMIGQLFGYRSRVVHRGQRLEVPAALNIYVRSVFEDLLWHKLGWASEGRAMAELAKPGFDLRALLGLKSSPS